MDTPMIFQPFKLRDLTVKNRLFRSYLRPARQRRWFGRAGADQLGRVPSRAAVCRKLHLLSSSLRTSPCGGRIHAELARIIDSGQNLSPLACSGRTGHLRHHCRSTVVQLRHSGRQRTIPALRNFESKKALSSTQPHGYLSWTCSAKR